ncbi:serine hydrolase [Kutzneria albida]|uniref:Beta-lactamase class A catalytic domain-containing protein n=1 Tax=Kutzneria albida DSM 43870 TaxID=1449976 RepID=W5WHX2_9PSEU|nr:serine hydrolase [Kutzneria albida]AHI00799.1 hypothetical protein KALB_7441 [Kutzneria albida DSM 43870]
MSVGAVVAGLTIGAGYTAQVHGQPVAVSATPSAVSRATRTTTTTATPPPATSSGGPAKSPDDALAEALAPVLANLTGQLSVGVLDVSTGTSASYNGKQSFTTASIVKADILAVLLLQTQQQGISLTSGQQQAAQQMIENSDNDSATALWDEAGSEAGMRAANTRFGLTATDPGADDYWGLTTTTVGDQLQLLTALTTSRSPLSQAARSYAIGLMSNIEPDQVWGVSAAADRGTTPVLKNGWLPVDADNDLWAVNSIGQVVSGGHTFLIAVLSGSQPDEDTGIAQVSAAAKAAVKPFL